MFGTFNCPMLIIIEYVRNLGCAITRGIEITQNLNTKVSFFLHISLLFSRIHQIQHHCVSWLKKINISLIYWTFLCNLLNNFITYFRFIMFVGIIVLIRWIIHLDKNVLVVGELEFCELSLNLTLWICCEIVFSH